MEGTRRRRRPALSCHECQRRKVRCDHSQPCGPCARHKAQCVYSRFRPGVATQGPADERVRSPGDSLANTATSPEQMIHISGLPSPSLSRAGIAASEGRQGEEGPEVVTEAHNVPTLIDLLRRIQKLEEAVSIQAGAADNAALNALSEAADRCGHVAPQHPPGLQQHRHPMLNKPEDWDKRGWLTGSPEFSAIMSCLDEIGERDSKNPHFRAPKARALITQATELLRSCKSIAKSIRLDQPARDYLTFPGSGLVPPERERSDEMVKLYFSSFESTHRILHAPTFLAEYQKFWDHPHTITEELRHKVLLVIGIGSSVYQHGDIAAAQRNTDLVQQWISAAQARLSAMAERERLDITGLQIRCLALLARQIFSVDGDIFWVSTGSLIHSAMQIGLHRDPKHLPTVSVFQAEIRRRLWATILELVIQASLVAWMPPRISLDEFDTEPPSNINDDDLAESTTALHPHPPATLTSTSLQRALLASFPARLAIAQLLNTFHPAHRSYNLALTLTTQLTSSLQSQATKFAFANPFHRNLLDYLTRRFLIALHFPFSLHARGNPMFHASHRASLDAALALLAPLIPPEADRLDPDGRFGRLVILGGGLFRDGIRGATAVVCLALISHTETQLTTGSLPLTSLPRAALKQTVRSLLARAAERIVTPRAETSVRRHMYLSMVLGLVGAMENASSSPSSSLPGRVEVEEAVARAAREGGGGGGGGGVGVEGFGGECAWESFFSGGGFY
ncbi:C6 zinc finger domain protein [Staphylotrichum tortipilum]|uniref:C6 zinc finger domain protein n=1 Tax=Staphylotrichum tortipilum TaxID=2831512 RepID=A0AAN6MJA6_9PEZI|nr:C6 zinc finger domain protein [Staphylotrichum longicolle]